MLSPTRERILDGAARAVARYGVAKLDMGDVSVTSQVSRGTLYRYFPSRDALLTELARHEGERFKQQVLAAIGDARGPERILVAVEHATRHVQEHPVLQRLLETDPAFVLQGVQREFPTIRAEFGAVLAPLFAELQLVRRGVVTAAQLVDWTVRLMVSAYLLPEAGSDNMAGGLTAVYRRLLAGELPARRSPRRTPKPRSRRS